MIVSDETRKWIKMRLKILDKSYQELADEVGLSFPYISMVVGRKNAIIPAKKLNKILEHLGFENKNILELNLKEEASMKYKKEQNRQRHQIILLNEIKDLMDMWGYTQMDLAQALGVSKQYISQIFKNKTLFSNKQYEKWHTTLCDMQRRKVQQMNEDF